jgi:hypothetical protein
VRALIFRQVVEKDGDRLAAAKAISRLSLILMVGGFLLMSYLGRDHDRMGTKKSVRNFQKSLTSSPAPVLPQPAQNFPLPNIGATIPPEPTHHRGGHINIPVDPNPMPPFTEGLELNKISTPDLLERTEKLTVEFRTLLNEIQPQEAYWRNYGSGQLHRLYKRFNYVDNQKMIFETELRRRGCKGKIIV